MGHTVPTVSLFRGKIRRDISCIQYILPFRFCQIARRKSYELSNHAVSFLQDTFPFSADAKSLSISFPAFSSTWGASSCTKCRKCARYQSEAFAAGLRFGASPVFGMAWGFAFSKETASFLKKGGPPSGSPSVSCGRAEIKAHATPGEICNGRRKIFQPI